MGLPVTNDTPTVLDGLSAPAGASWAEAARDAAKARLAQMGLPARRDEYWKFTNPERLTSADGPDAAVTTAPSPFADVKPVRIVFSGGQLSSEAPSLEGVEIKPLSQALSTDIHWAKDLYGVLEAKGQDPVARPLAALNTGYATDGIVVHVTQTPDRPIEIVYEPGEGMPVLHHLLKVEAGASVTVLETGAPAARYNTSFEIDLAAGASCHHLRVQTSERVAATHMFSRLAADAQLKSFTLSAQGALTRNEQIVEFTGDDASAHVAGATLGHGDVHHDDTVFITHDAVNCESRQVFKKVLEAGAVGVFQGKILVKPDAQKTDGYQISQSLLLDDNAQFLAKPELEIYADDVACSHGSTTGAIDEDALFYLQSRGVPKPIATDLLVLSFLAEAVEEIADKALQEIITAKIERLLQDIRS